MAKGRQFLEEYLNYGTPSQYEVAVAVLLLYHSFGPSLEKPVDPNSIIY